MTNFNEEQQESTGFIDNSNYLRLRGLPYSATNDDIRKFFGPETNVIDVYIVQNMDGKASGDAYIQLETDDDMQKALQKHQQHLGKRYIDVFTINDVESNQIVRRMKRRAAASHQGTIRVRGVPFSCTEEELKSFFKDLDIVEVIFGKEPGGRLSGEAYVRFGSKGDAEKASHLSGQYLGRRYLEIFNIDNDQFDNFKESQNAQSNQMSRGGARPFNEVTSGEDSWSGYGPQRRQSNNNYSSYQEPQQQMYGGNSANNYQQQQYSGNQSYGRPVQQQSANRTPIGAQPAARNGQNYGSSNSTYAQGYGNTTQNYGTGSQGYDPYSYSATTYDYNGGSRGTATNYGSAQQNQYGAPPSRQYGGNDYGNRSYGSQQQHTYSQEMPGDNRPYQSRGSGRIVGGEILNPLKVHMRGLPYRVTAKEIEQFFSPLQIVEIKTGILEDGRASGDGIVEFNSEADANEALTRDKQSIKSRYIELFSHENAKISGRTSYRSILSRATGGYAARDQQQQGQSKPLFAPW